MTDIAYLGVIFEKWASQYATRNLRVGQEYPKTYILFKLEEGVYRSTIFTRDTLVAFKRIRTLNVRLGANTLPSDSHHSYTGAEYQTAFAPIIAWMRKFLRIPEGYAPQANHYLTSNGERVIFLTYEGNAVKLIFRPEFPEIDFADCWE